MVLGTCCLVLSVAVFGKYDPRTDYHSGTEIDKQCCFDVKQVVHPFELHLKCVAHLQSNNV